MKTAIANIADEEMKVCLHQVISHVTQLISMELESHSTLF
jgi:hypothetical protein